MDNTKRTLPTKLANVTNTGSEIVATNKGPTWVSTRSSGYRLLLLASYFSGIPNRGNSVISDSLAHFLSSFNMRAFCFVLFDCVFLGGLIFSEDETEWKRFLGRGEIEGSWKEWREGSTDWEVF